MINAKLGGYRPDISSATDFDFNDVVNNVQLTESPTAGVVDLRRFCSPVEDQAQVGSCVGNAVVGALEMLQTIEGIPYKDLSRLFVYFNARLMDQIQDKDDGSSIRLAMGTLSSLGTCTETKWPYDPSKVFIRPTWGCYREAFANRIDEYYKIGGSGTTRIEFIKRALQAKFPVVFGMIVDQAYMWTGSDGIVSMPKSIRVNPGSHAQVIVGYDDNVKRLIVRNSWGTSFGDSGYAYVPYDYLDAADAGDFWVPMRAK